MLKGLLRFVKKINVICDCRYAVTELRKQANRMTFGEINEDIIQVGSLVQFYFVDFRIKKINWGQPRECSAAPTLNRISVFFTQLSKQGNGKGLLLLQMT